MIDHQRILWQTSWSERQSSAQQPLAYYLDLVAHVHGQVYGVCSTRAVLHGAMALLFRFAGSRSACSAVRTIRENWEHRRDRGCGACAQGPGSGPVPQG